MVACKTKFVQFIQVGLMMMTSTRMWIAFEMNIISTFQHKIWGKVIGGHVFIHVKHETQHF